MKINKKWLIIFLIGIFIFVGIFSLIYYLRIIFADIEVVLVDDLTIEFLSEKKVSDFIKSINGKIIDDYIISSNNIGKKNISFKYINDDGIKVSYSFEVDVVDRVKPIIWVSNKYTVLVNSEDNIKDSIMCGDNEDPRPKCYIEGEYDLTTVGEYKLKYNAVDRSGNNAERNIILYVVDKIDNNSNTKKKSVAFDYVVS